MRAVAGWCCSLFSLGLVVGMVGCSGPRLDLSTVKVTQLRAIWPEGAPGPGHPAPLVLVATLSDGSEHRTVGPGDGDLGWEGFRVQVEGGSLGKRGMVSLDPSLMARPADPVRVRVDMPGQVGVKLETEVLPRFTFAERVNFSGRPGRNGHSGFNGSRGTSGTSGFPDKPGGPGGRGQDGQDGEHGGPGEDAPAVLVRVAFVEGPRPLLQVKVDAAGGSRLFVIDPNGGSVFIQADGGRGGDGGHGGDAGSGGSGGLGKPDGPPGKPGDPGQGGRAGSGGAGAPVEMIVDPKAERYLHAITFSCRGGEPGNPGRNGSPEGRWPNPRPATYGPSAPPPIVRIQSVGPLL